MSDILQKIATYKRSEIDRAKIIMPRASLERQIANQSSPRGFAKAIETQIAGEHFALIAEIKKASPSKGLIREKFVPTDLAKAYAKGGATCLSVLTDTPSFQGKAEDLKDARASVSLPVLRKDFLLDPYQVFEARAWGADCILIIMAMVDDATASSLNRTAHDLGLDVLVEVHNHAELKRALSLETKLIGINNRNLHDFVTSLTVSKTLAKHVPQDRIIVSESGITSHADCAQLAAHGIGTFLVGESLMRQEDVTQATRMLLNGKA